VQAEIEAVKGKRYRLHKVHGPWMVMVAALRDVPEDRRTKDGLSAWEAADQLIYELRVKGIPAYAYLQGREVETLDSSRNDTSQSAPRTYISRHQSIAVLAGNFNSVDDEDAIVIRDFIKKYEPSFLRSKKSGGLFSVTPGRSGPLSGAFLAPNPLRSPEDIRRNTIDPVVKQLNADMKYSLLRNKGKFTLVVATFSGKSVFQVGHKTTDKAMGKFLSQFGDALDESAMDAWQLTEAMRTARKLGYDRDYDAWVYHDRYRSIVTVGSFESENDPRIAELARAFSAKSRVHPETGENVQSAELFSIPKVPRNGAAPERMWLFDVKPTLIEVPKH
jgi:hypothetical protein